MGVEMDRQVGGFAQGGEQLPRRRRLQQTGHVLDRDDMRAGFFKLRRKPGVVFQIVFRAGRIEDVAGVTDRSFTKPVFLAHGVHRHPHVFHPVEAVEHPEQANATLRSLTHEMLDHVVGIILVANAIGATQKHLQKQVGRALAHQIKPLPRILGQKPHRHVEGRPTPAFQ